MFLCLKRVKYCKEIIEARVGIYMCPLKIKIMAIYFHKLIIDKIINVETDCYNTI